MLKILIGVCMAIMGVSQAISALHQTRQGKNPRLAMIASMMGFAASVVLIIGP